ncbi:MAG: hypothetical protein R3C30_11845 [Hyphomonadaceae bacterium]
MTIKIFEPGDTLPQLPSELETFSFEDNDARFGLKAVEENGQWKWVPATEEEFRDAEAERLGVSPNDVVMYSSCYQTGPRSCSLGGCWSGGMCRLVYNSAGNHYYCACM